MSTLCYSFSWVYVECSVFQEHDVNDLKCVSSSPLRSISSSITNLPFALSLSLIKLFKDGSSAQHTDPRWSFQLSGTVPNNKTYLNQ